MIRMFSTKSLIASAIALGAVVAGSAAHAQTDVRLVVDLNTPHRYVQPAPVFVHQQQMPLQARPIYTRPQTVEFGHDRDRDGDRFDRFGRNDRFDRSERFAGNDRFDRFDRRGGAMGDADHDGVLNRFDRDSRFYDARAMQRHARWADFDGDGVVNQFDRAPRNPRRY